MHWRGIPFICWRFQFTGLRTMAQTTITRRDLRAPAADVGPVPSPATPDTGWRRLVAGLPTLFVVGALAAVAYWGYRTNWTLPKFSALIGREVNQSDDWCAEHNVLESQCIECRADLLPPDKDYGWCKEHGVAQCPFHHSEVAQLKDRPDVSSELMEQATRALTLRPRAENNSRCKLHLRRIQFASEAAVEKAGVDIDVAQEQSIVEAAVANGEIRYDDTRMAHLASRVSGTAWRVYRQVGDHVQKGDVLALIDAAEVGKAKGEFLQAITHVEHETTTLEKLKPLADTRAVSGRQYREAKISLEDAQIALKNAQQVLVNLGFRVSLDDLADLDLDEVTERLRFLGLPDDLTDRLDKSETTSNLFPIKSPIDGLVVARNLVAGEVVDIVTELFSVADVGQMWLMLDVPQEDAQYLSLGQQVRFNTHDGGESDIVGSLSWISTSIDDRTRTLKVRVDVPNANGRLRANAFGTGRIVLREEARAVVVPSEAVHWDGCCHIVFVRDKNYLDPAAPKFFHVRKVRLGVKADGNTEIIVGLLPGEVIATKNSVVLEAQLLKSNLGAGCGCAAGD